jgi:hypothetical protein
MHQKLADRGLACISVTVDEATDEESVNKARTFLVNQKATLENYLLNESAEVWQRRLDAEGPPAIFVFDRQGKRAAKFGVNGVEPFTHEQIEKLVLELLDRKP